MSESKRFADMQAEPGPRVPAPEARSHSPEGRHSPSTVPFRISARVAPRVQRLDSSAGTTTAASALVVEDAEPAGIHQMTKSRFFDALEAQIGSTMEDALAGSGFTAKNCPWFVYLLAEWRAKDATRVNALIARYAGAGVESAAAAVPFVAERVRQKIHHWRRTGEVQAPEESDWNEGEALGETRVQALGADGANAATMHPAAVQRRLGLGEMLPTGVRGRMEGALGGSLDEVRIHTGSEAARLAGGIGARAFAVGRDIAFALGEYQPGTLTGDAVLAHELTHVLQQQGHAYQSGGPSYGALEDEADRGAWTALSRLWGEDREGGGATASAVGLRLQSCKNEISSGPIGPRRLADSIRRFAKNNDDLSDAQLAKIQAALTAVAGDNLNLQISFYDRYTNSDLDVADASTARKWKARKNPLYAETGQSGHTEIRPDVLDPSFPNGQLGALLLHEFTHTRHQVGMGGEAQEGESYAVEYFFAERTKQAKRVKEIDNIFSDPEQVVLSAHKPIFKRLARETYGTLAGLYEVIDTGKSVAGGPFAGLSRDDARRLAAEIVAVAEDSRSTQLKAIVKWVLANTGKFKMPV